jgi:hypothetical protein
MATEPIPFANLQESGHEVLAGASPIAMNVVVDGKGSVLRRPGIKAYSGAPSTVIDADGIAGLHITVAGNLFAVGVGGAERPIYQVTSGGAAAIGGGVAPNGLRGTVRPVFAETELLVAIAGGDVLQKVVKPTAHFALSSSRMGGTPVPVASHVMANNLRFLANDVSVDRTKVRFSDVASGDTDFSGNEVWSLGGVGTSGYFTAEANPDPVVALYGVQNEIMVFGSTTTQVFVPDAQQTYAPVGVVDVGMVAPYSFVRNDREVFWMDHQRRFVVSDRRSFRPISDAIQRTLEGIGTVADAFGYRVSDAFLDVPVWTFPTDGRTFVYQKEIGWGQWSGWNDSTNNWAPFSVTCLAVPPDASVNVVGTSDGKVGELSLDANTDLGTRINAYVETGYLNRKTEKYKHCRCVTLTFRRGAATTSPGPQGMLYFRDREGPWSDPIPLDLGASGDTEPTLRFHSLGSYQRRQWKFVFSDTSVALALVAAFEEFEVSDN